MDIYSKKRFTFWTIIILIILNIFTVSMLWLNQNRPIRMPPRMREPGQNQRALQLLQKELDLTDSQIQQYHQLGLINKRKTSVLINDIRLLKKEMIDKIFKNEPDTIKVMEIAALIGKKQTEVEQITFKHFLDLKELCGVEQVDKLQGLVDEFFRRHPPSGQKKPTPHEPGRPMNPPQREHRK